MIDKIGSDQSSKKKWEMLSNDYLKNLEDNYHKSRFECILSLIPETKNKTILDFGAGTGILSDILIKKGVKSSLAIERNETLLNYGKKHYSNINFKLGDLYSLKNIKTKFDLVICANVIAYFSNDEKDLFFKQIRNMINRNGFLIISEPNELFDLFTLNKFTVNFFQNHFNTRIDNLVSFPKEPKRSGFSQKINPLTLKYEMEKYGFFIDDEEFANFHKEIPLLSNKDPDDMKRERLNSVNVKKEEFWKYMFQSSIYVVRLGLVK